MSGFSGLPLEQTIKGTKKFCKRVRHKVTIVL